MNPTNAMTDGHFFSAPLGSVTAGRLELSGGAANLNLRLLVPASDMPRESQSLMEAVFEGTPPEVQITDGDVRLQYRHRFWLFDCRRVGAEIALHPALPWSVVFRGGVSKLNADLTRLPILDVQILGGVSELKLVLPKPDGTVKVRVTGGVSDALVLCPAGVPLRVSVRGGATHLHVDRLVLGAVGAGFEWESPDYAASTNRLEIEVEGGATELTVRTLQEARPNTQPAAALVAS